MKKIIISMFLLVAMLTGCSNEIKEYEVIFESNGGTELDTIIVEEGYVLIEPLEPTRDNFLFVDWYSDEDFTIVITFGNEISNDLTLYAKWAYDSSLEVEGIIDLNTLPYYEYFSETNPVITIEVQGIGVMVLELFPSVAPNTVNNFIMYIENGDFSGNVFHRIIEDFMIQGGDINSTICPIEGDFLSNGVQNDLSHFRGTISMARTSIMNSATSQFFIVHEDSLFLDGNYATFGGLISGFNVLDYIAEVSTNAGDAPLVPVTIDSITVDLNGYEAVNPICGN